MKKTVFISLLCVAFFSTATIAQNNTLTEKEKSEGWILMFDGETFNGWRQYNGTAMAPFWTIDQEAMRIASRAERPPRVEGQPRIPSSDIIFADKQFKNFELSIDWMVGRGANSGIFYYVQEIPGQAIFAAAPEIQILDNWNAPDNRLTANLAGSLYNMRPALPQVANPHNMWNRMVIRVKDGHVTHHMNGTKVVEYTLWTPEWDELIANSKFHDWEHFKNGPSRTGGYIGLQDHQDFPVWFRNIKIREL
ncbi:MAG: DUF1080 domain-containing protein [Dysgonamonadaceae bacterium]|jgi:hypothetical protein|nr:DUF1080 domain-containing protein [Dysgonamonadaceae bacterium]